MVAQLKSAPAKQQAAFGLKGNLLTLTVMQLFQADPQAIAEQLQKTVAATPKFFTNMPIVLDLQHLAAYEHPIDYQAITHHLREHGLIPMGISNGTPKQLATANLAGLGTLSQIKKDIPTKGPEPAAQIEAPKAADPATNPRSKVILSPVRSGQQVYAKGGDLIILAPVSAGAEILADGHIHVYSTLRGRALAGVQGDKSARIFCSALQAELISIAGHYKLQENIEAPSSTAPVQVFIEGDQLQIALLQ